MGGWWDWLSGAGRRLSRERLRRKNPLVKGLPAGTAAEVAAGERGLAGDDPQVVLLRGQLDPDSPDSSH
jgi:hypothetical protein